MDVVYLWLEMFLVLALWVCVIVGWTFLSGLSGGYLLMKLSIQDSISVAGEIMSSSQTAGFRVLSLTAC